MPRPTSAGWLCDSAGGSGGGGGFFGTTAPGLRARLTSRRLNRFFDAAEAVTARGRGRSCCLALGCADFASSSTFSSSPPAPFEEARAARDGGILKTSPCSRAWGQPRRRFIVGLSDTGRLSWSRRRADLSSESSVRSLTRNGDGAGTSREESDSVVEAAGNSFARCGARTAEESGGQNLDRRGACKSEQKYSSKQ